MNQVHTVEEQIKMAPPCPHCGGTDIMVDPMWARRRVGPDKLKTTKRHVVCCVTCGAQSGHAESVEEALLNWYSRTIGEWVPLGEHTFLLPSGQPYTHMMIYGRGDVSFIRYTEEGKIDAQVDIDLGKHRIAGWLAQTKTGTVVGPEAHD